MHADVWQDLLIPPHCKYTNCVAMFAICQWHWWDLKWHMIVTINLRFGTLQESYTTPNRSTPHPGNPPGPNDVKDFPSKQPCCWGSLLGVIQVVQLRRCFHLQTLGHGGEKSQTGFVGLAWMEKNESTWWIKQTLGKGCVENGRFRCEVGVFHFMKWRVVLRCSRVCQKHHIQIFSDRNT